MNELSLLYLHSKTLGYGRMGVEIAAALADQGVDVYDHLESEHTEELERMIASGRRSKLTNAVCWLSVPMHARGWWEGQHTSMFTMWEAERLPEAFRDTMHEFDTLIVPSLHNVELFSKYHQNVKYDPLGVNPDIWHYTPRKESIFFDFLIGGSGDRKGQDLAARAFRKLWKVEGSWGDGPIPRLIFKSPKGNPECRGVSLVHDRMIQSSGKLSDEDEVALYETAHCYLGPSRGEGFGLQPLQAIAQGLPTILTNAHGHASFAHLGIGLDAKPDPAGYFIYGDAGMWWEPDFDQLIEAMREVYDDYDRYLAKAKIAAKVVARDWTWGSTAARLRTILGDALTVPYSGDHSWHRVQERLYPVMTIMDKTYEIGGFQYIFTRGVETYVPADVKRILFEAGILDPACIDHDEDDALTPSQAARAGKYRADHAYCPTCGQQANTRPTRADAIYDEMCMEEQARLVAG